MQSKTIIFVINVYSTKYGGYTIPALNKDGAQIKPYIQI